MPAPRRDLVRKAFGVVETEPLDDRQVRVVISTSETDRSGDVVVQKGIDCANFKRSRTVLWNHDQDHPVAKCVQIDIAEGRTVATAQFPEPGISAKADEVYGLLKAGVINAASIGFLPLDVEPVDGKNPRKGLRIDKSELMEFSFVSVPANSGAEVLQRAWRGSAHAPALSRKGLEAVAALARLLTMLGYQVDSSLAERAREGDTSDVPDQLRSAMNGLGAALVAMTGEEVAELLAGKSDDDDIYGCDAPMLLALLDGFRVKSGAVVKAGRRISKATDTALRGHLDTIGDAHGAMVKMLDAAKTDDDGDDAESDDDDAAEQKRAAWSARSRAEITRLAALA